MSREIKFRAISIETEKWVKGFIYEHLPPLKCFGKTGEPSTFFIHRTAFADWSMPREVEQIPVKRETIGQYTGLKDKNGTEIYEGDIVKFFDLDENEILSHVVFKSGRFRVTSTIECYPDLMEIIGTIYENPELLK